MNEITLPPLPEPLCNLPTHCQDAIKQYTRSVVDDYLNEQQAAIEADRQRGGEPVDPYNEWADYAKRSGLLNDDGIAPEPAQAQTAWNAFSYAWNRSYRANVALQPAEPVKVPSEAWLLVEKYADAVSSYNDAVRIDVGIDKAGQECISIEMELRALLARYAAQLAQPAANAELPVTEQEQEAWQQMERRS